MTPQSMYRVYSRDIRELGYSPEEWGVSGYAILDAPSRLSMGGVTR